jgi:capsular polysaccharide biosynthesis protein
MKEMKQVEGAIRLFQGRIEAAPVGEQQYAEVIRDHEIGKLKYEDLNRKMSQSQISSELEKRQQGETLEVLDPASLPQTPTQPKRPIVVAIGVAIGIVMGLFFAGAREAKDTSLKNLKDVRAYTQLTILGSVPLLENDLVVRRRKRLAWLAWSTACLVGIVIMTGSVFFYYNGKV